MITIQRKIAISIALLNKLVERAEKLQTNRAELENCKFIEAVLIQNWIRMVKTNAHRRKRQKANLRDHVRRGVSSSLLQQDQIVHTRLQNTTSNTETVPEIQPASSQLRLWALKHNITRNALSDLLKILIAFGMTWLPADSRTLLETPQNITTVNIANGQLWYNGIEKNLRRIFEKLNKNVTLLLNFNVDGIPIFKSAKKEFWPILANMHSM